MGVCSCRHEKEHAGVAPCGAPLDNCSALGPAADYLIRHRMAREVTKSEMLENVARSREAGLVMNGTLELWVNDEHYRLHAGDSFAFPSTTPHRCANHGKKPVKVLWVITPPHY